MSEPNDNPFHLSPPLWAVLDRETVELDPGTGGAALKRPVRAAAGVFAGAATVLLFTDEGLANLYIRAMGLGGVALPLHSRVHVVDFLERQVPAGFTHAAFDPRPAGGTCRWVVPIADVLRQAEPPGAKRAP